MAKTRGLEAQNTCFLLRKQNFYGKLHFYFFFTQSKAYLEPNVYKTRKTIKYQTISRIKMETTTLLDGVVKVVA